MYTNWFMSIKTLIKIWISWQLICSWRLLDFYIIVLYRSVETICTCDIWYLALLQSVRFLIILWQCDISQISKFMLFIYLIYWYIIYKTNKPLVWFFFFIFYSLLLFSDFYIMQLIFFKKCTRLALWLYFLYTYLN